MFLALGIPELVTVRCEKRGIWEVRIGLFLACIRETKAQAERTRIDILDGLGCPLREIETIDTP